MTEFETIALALLTEIRDALGTKPAPAIGPVFPFGKSKGQSVTGASERDLNYYRDAAIKSLSDDSKKRFWDTERERLAAYEQEMTKRGFRFKGEATEPIPNAPPSEFANENADGDVPF
jgi:hypothetical protein